jgi:glycine dehydrogenase subunit 2
MLIKEEPIIFELSVPGRTAFLPPACDVPQKELDEMIPKSLQRDCQPNLPQVSEADAVRHYTRLSLKNYGADAGFYPLGSCTMKYNPKINEELASLEGFAATHPYQPEKTVQGNLKILFETSRMLSEIIGMEQVTLQPAAGSHGELTGLMIIKAYHAHNGQTARNIIITPDSAHGTNPASAAAAGFEVAVVGSDENGNVDINALKSLMSDRVAGLMLTNPNTLGLFESNIIEIADIVHKAGGLLYYDGANLNAIVGKCRPGDMGFDVAHLNLHKTFSTPHGTGGPGSGPVGVKKELIPFLPKPIIEYANDEYTLNYNRPLSIGRVRSFYGNFGVVLRAYAYLRTLGSQGLTDVAEAAVLNANYIKEKLKESYLLPYNRNCMHEVVFSGELQKKLGISTLDIAKRLIDYGYHPPTVYFPLIVKEALMIEPTETESRETLDEFIAAMKAIALEVKLEPDTVKSAPHDTPVARLDEVKAARSPVLKFKFGTE